MNRHSNFLPGEAGFLLKLLQEVCTHLFMHAFYIIRRRRYTERRKLVTSTHF